MPRATEAMLAGRGDGRGAFHGASESIPSTPGAYVLRIDLGAPLVVALPGRGVVTFGAGRYLYCGSARGPGGLRARVARHMRRGKAVRWHVDRLTEAGRVVGAWVFPGGDECALVARLDGFPVPLAGFGGSDCAVCPSHLLAWPAGAPSPFEED